MILLILVYYIDFDLGSYYFGNKIPFFIVLIFKYIAIKLFDFLYIIFIIYEVNHKHKLNENEYLKYIPYY